MTNPPYVPREYLSITTLMDFARCARRYFHRKSGLVPLDEPGAPLYGQAMHKAIVPGMMHGLDAGMAAFQTVWKEELADTKRSLARARAQLSHYVHTHTQGRAIFKFEKPPEGAIKLDESTSDFEVPFAIDVGLPGGLPITGRIDGLVSHRDTGELWGYEFKTTGRLTSSLFEAMEVHPQTLGYTLALRTLTDKPVRGMIVEGMLIDKLKVDNLTHLVPVQDHMVNGARDWLRFYGELLLACEKRFLETNDVDQAFIRNWAGCSPYPWFYTPGWACEFSTLCKVEDWQPLTAMYGHREDHKFIQVTASAKEGK